MPSFKILLVHYDPSALERFRQILEEGGFEVHSARDGSSAVQSLLEVSPDLVLLEAMLPRVHGFEVCQDIKKTRQGKNTPVVVMTTVYKGRKYRDEAIHTHGADDFVELPVDDAQLLAIVKRSIKAGSAPMPEMEAGI